MRHATACDCAASKVADRSIKRRGFNLNLARGTVDGSLIAAWALASELDSDLEWRRHDPTAF